MKSFGVILFQIILLELVLGGGGRFTAFGPISLRMILFSAALCYTACSLWKENSVNREYFGLILLFTIITTLSVATGFLAKAESMLILQDVKPLSYFLILPFFALTITDKDDLGKIISLVIHSAFVLSITYLLVLVLVNTGIIPFKIFYRLTSPTEELFYRGEMAFFYKGFVFLCIALIFIYFSRPNYAGLLASVIILAIILTFTRGFMFALLLTAFVYLILQKLPLKYKISIMAITLAGAIFIGLKGSQLYAEFSKVIYKSEIKPSFTRDFKPDKLFGDRDFSNNERIKQFNQVKERTTFTSSLIGHGFGIGVPVRPVHMEISYLEIFHKQGIIGLLFWGLIFYILTKKALVAAKKDIKLTSAFYFGTLFLFFQSLTNQYFNNPIGMSFVLISIVSLDVISKNDD